MATWEECNKAIEPITPPATPNSGLTVLDMGRVEDDTPYYEGSAIRAIREQKPWVISEESDGYTSYYYLTYTGSGTVGYSAGGYEIHIEPIQVEFIEATERYYYVYNPATDRYELGEAPR